MARPRALDHLALLTSVALGLAPTLACKSKTDDAAASSGEAAPAAGDAADQPAAEEAGADTGASPAELEPQEADDPRTAEVEITKASAAASTTAKGTRSLGFNLEKISHLFALKATAKLPEWGAAGEGEPKLARDDDLDTAWHCEFGQDKPCAFGLALPEKAKIEVVRLYTAAGPRYREHKGHPRVKKVRVHTDAGFVEASLSDTANHTYVRFDTPIESQSLAIEVVEIFDGKQDKQVHIAEVELYGTDGVAREPIVLDPARAWLGWETTTWGDGPDHTIRQVFVYFARPGPSGEDGPPRRRFSRATAVFGEAGDDYALFERLRGTSCDEVQGGYVLFDKRNRMYYPLNDLGGAGGEVFRHIDGHGFAVGSTNEDGLFTIKGIIDDGGKLKWKRGPKQGTDDREGLLREWDFSPEPLARGVAHGGAVPGCHRAATGELEPVISAARLGSDDDLDPAAWMICSVGGDTLYASAPCDAPARAYQLDGAGKIVGKHESKDDDARGLRMRRNGDQVFVELSAKQGDTATLALAEPGQFTILERNGGLFLRPPSSCAPCDDRFTAAVGEDEDYRDEGGLDEDWDEDYRDEGDIGEDEPEDGDEPEDEPEDGDEPEDADEPEPAEPRARARPVPPPSPTPPG